MRMTTDTRLPDLELTDDWRDQAACIQYAQSVEFFPAR